MACSFFHTEIKVSKGAKIRNRCNQVPHLTKDTNGKVTNSILDTTNESQEVSPFPAGDHKAQINRRTQSHNKHKSEKNINDPQKKYRLGTVSKNILLKGLNRFHGVNLTLNSQHAHSRTAVRNSRTERAMHALIIWYIRAKT